MLLLKTDSVCLCVHDLKWHRMNVGHCVSKGLYKLLNDCAQLKLLMNRMCLDNDDICAGLCVCVWLETAIKRECASSTLCSHSNCVCVHIYAYLWMHTQQ